MRRAFPRVRVRRHFGLDQVAQSCANPRGRDQGCRMSRNSLQQRAN
jgi:hypothetical protein